MSLRPTQLTVGSTPIGKAITWSYPNHDRKTYFTPTYPLEVSGTDGRGEPIIWHFVRAEARSSDLSENAQPLNMKTVIDPLMIT